MFLLNLNGKYDVVSTFRLKGPLQNYVMFTFRFDRNMAVFLQMFMFIIENTHPDSHIYNTTIYDQWDDLVFVFK